MVAPDGTNPQDGAKPGTGDAGTSQGNDTFTKAQVEEAVRKARSDAMADVGRLRKAVDDAMKVANAATERLTRFQKDQEEAELAAVKDDPDKLTSIRARQRAKELEAQLAERDAKLSEANTKLAEYNQKEAEEAKGKVAREVAKELEVDAATLVKLAKYTDGSLEAIKDIASTLPKKQESNNNPSPNFRPDSNRTSGGASKTVMQTKQDYISGRINAVQYEEQLKALGAKP